MEGNYAFMYEDKKWTLISLKHLSTFSNEYRYINYLEGVDIIFM